MADTYASTGREGTTERNAIRLWMSSITAPVVSATKESIFRIVTVFMAATLSSAEEPIYDFRPGMLTSVAASLPFIEIKVFDGSLKKRLYTIQRRKADTSALLKAHQRVVDVRTHSKLMARAADAEARVREFESSAPELDPTDNDEDIHWGAQAAKFSEPYLVQLAMCWGIQSSLSMTTFPLLALVIFSAMVDEAKSRGVTDLSQLTDSFITTLAPSTWSLAKGMEKWQTIKDFDNMNLFSSARAVFFQSDEGNKKDAKILHTMASALIRGTVVLIYTGGLSVCGGTVATAVMNNAARIEISHGGPARCRLMLLCDAPPPK